MGYNTQLLPTVVIRQRQIIGNINDQAERDVNDNFNPLYSKLVFLPIIGVLLGFILCVSSMGSFSSSLDDSDSFGPPTGFFVGMILFGLCGFGQVITCCLVGKAHVNAVQIAIDTMKQYVEITLNEQWQKECGVRWTVTTQQTLSVNETNHHQHGHHGHHGGHHGHHHGHHQRISVQTWYNIEVRVLNQVIQQVVVPVVVVQQNQVPPQYVPAMGTVPDNGTEGVYNANGPNVVIQSTEQPGYQ